MGELHGLLADCLIEQIRAWKEGRLVDMGKDGEWVKVFPANLMAQAIRFLKDNGIDAPRREGGKLDRLAKAMPDFDDLENVTPIRSHPRG
jgi:hypothetical protein